ncbi:MAG: hypothetical protein ACXU86_01025 [Archangium sp.]
MLLLAALLTVRQRTSAERSPWGDPRPGGMLGTRAGLAADYADASQ